MDRAAWRATVRGVTEGQTGLSGLNTRRLCSFKTVAHSRVHVRAHTPHASLKLTGLGFPQHLGCCCEMCYSRRLPWLAIACDAQKAMF